MPPKEEIDWNDVESIKRKVPSKKGKVTRLYNKIKDFVVLPSSRSSIEFAEQYRKELKEAYDELELYYARVSDLEEASHEENQVSQTKIYDEKYAPGMKLVCQYLAALDPVAQSSSAQQDQPAIRAHRVLKLTSSSSRRN